MNSHWGVSSSLQTQTEDPSLRNALKYQHWPPVRAVSELVLPCEQHLITDAEKRWGEDVPASFKAHHQKLGFVSMLKDISTAFFACEVLYALEKSSKAIPAVGRVGDGMHRQLKTLLTWYIQVYLSLLIPSLFCSRGLQSYPLESGSGIAEAQGEAHWDSHISEAQVLKDYGSQSNIQAPLVESRDEVQHLSTWCHDNNLTLNTQKTKEIIMDFRRPRSQAHPPVYISGAAVEQVTSFKFLGTHISSDLTWSLNPSVLVKKAQQRLYFLRSLKKVHLSPRILVNFYRCTTESILSNGLSV
ncbi:hypothetical protein NFI96_009297 [Prochilodus magdalenae]|nr:hypothetical protein NFI96_009297 [Prochilodus magdalenae]